MITVEQLMREDKDHKIKNVDDINKVKTDVGGLICQDITEIQWLISKLNNEQNRWTFEGTFTPASEDKKATYKQFINANERQTRTMQPLSVLKVESGSQPIPNLRLNADLLGGGFEETPTQFKLAVVEGKVKMEKFGTVPSK